MIWAIFNFIGAWYLWNVSQSAFEMKVNHLGWLALFFSALNFAAGMHSIT